MRWASSANGSTYAGFLARVLASVSLRVHSWMSRIAVHGSVGHADAELDRLREDDLLLGAEERDAGDLPEVQARRVLDVERLLVDDLGRLLVRIRGGRRGYGHGYDRLGLRGCGRELLVARLRDGVERKHGNELRLCRLDPFGPIFNEGDQR